MRWSILGALCVLCCAGGALAQTGGYTVALNSTTGGNDNGGSCVFPFQYKGNVYPECTVIDNRNRYWCATTSNYDTDRRWTFCRMSVNATRTRQGTGNSGGATCNFPFLYKGQFYYTCTTVDYNLKRPWCATSDNYDRDRKWGDCVVYPYIRTVPGSGSDGGRDCMMPFQWQKVWFAGCLRDRATGLPWCSTDRVYRGRWGTCIVESNDGNTGCDNSYTPFPETNALGGVPQQGVIGTRNCRSACNANGACRAFDYDGNPNANPKCFLHLGPFAQRASIGVTQFVLDRRTCTGPILGGGGVITGIRGNSFPGVDQCVFPFRFSRRTYASCTSKRWPVPWCALTDNYPRDKLWAECSNILTDAIPSP